MSKDAIIISKKKTGAKPCPVDICSDHTGKMEGMQSLSTACSTNQFCLRNCSIKGSICEHCYAQTMSKMYKALDAKLEHNTSVLTTRLLSPAEIPVINCQVFRFESFGDLHNETHLKNYIAIANANPRVRFTLWSKNYGVVLNYFKTHKCPDNFTMIISSMFINRRMSLAPFKATGAFKPGQLKVFTVYNYEYLTTHPGAVDINCGSRWCLGCRACYDENEIEEINEILKNEQSKTEKFIKRTSPEFSKECEELAEELDLVTL